MLYAKMLSTGNTHGFRVLSSICFAFALLFGCGVAAGLRVTCGTGKYPCANNASCIPKDYFCDGSYDCSDRSDEKGCEDGKECKIKACTHVCENSFNSAKCLCLKGYSLDSDGRTCSDDDECLNKTLCSQICVNTPGSYHCECRAGYIPDEEGSCLLNGTVTGKSNVETITCSVGKYPCENGASCIPESYVCDGSNDCSDGSDETGCESGVLCKKKRCEQECKEKTTLERISPVPSYSYSYNSRYNNNNNQPQYKEIKEAICSCKKGYRMNSTQKCNDIDECELRPCSHFCENVPGSYKCSCSDGYNLQKDNSTCKVSGDYPILISSAFKEISLSLMGPNRTYNFTGSSQNTILKAVFFGATSEIIWLETFVNGGMIKRMFSNGSSTVGTVLSRDFKNPEGLALDWLNSKIYISDRGEGIIAACSTDCKKCTKVMNDYSSSPVAIVLDVLEGSMYWSDWGSNRGIYKAGLDGSDKVAIVTKDIGRPNDLSIDHVHRVLYWCDLDKAGIFHVSLTDTTSNITISKISQVNEIINTLEVFEDSIYYAKKDSKEIKRYNMRTKTSENLFHAKDPVVHIEVYHSVLNPIDSHNNPCDQSNCSQVCLLAPNDTYKCACHDGHKLKNDGVTCLRRRTFKGETTETLNLKSNISSQDRRTNITDSIEYYNEDNDIAYTPKPKLISLPKEVTAHVGQDDINLPCEVDNRGPYVTLWKKGKQGDVLSVDIVKMNPDQSYIVEANRSLTIRNLRPVHSDIYTCVIVSEPNVYLTHRVNVLSPPEITFHPAAEVSVLSGETFNLTCEVSGNPRPNITWKKMGDQDIPIDNIVFENGVMAFASIKDVQAGTYECLAYNGVGENKISRVNVKVLHSEEKAKGDAKFEDSLELDIDNTFGTSPAPEIWNN